MTDKELRDALDGIYAYDRGSVDSGIHDEALRARCIAALKERRDGDATAFRLFMSRLIRDLWLSEEALARGYGIGDAVDFVAWLSDWMEIEV